MYGGGGVRDRVAAVVAAVTVVTVVTSLIPMLRWRLTFVSFLKGTVVLGILWATDVMFSY
jgi:hypothetical protein